LKAKKLKETKMRLGIYLTKKLGYNIKDLVKLTLEERQKFVDEDKKVITEAQHNKE
jgi:hypothetical protein